MEFIDKINSPNDIKKLSHSALYVLSNEIREFLIEKVSKEGGHLASNLGVVELTIALHRVFDTPKDKIVWDVGHQTYVHKILTGRKDRFNTLRKYEGLSGFPKREESIHDSFNTGHSSTSISAGLGFARARDIKNEDHAVISVIGDGALTGGLAYEALNDAGRSNTNFIVILNDNEMSISHNVGGISTYLSKLRTNPSYYNFRDEVETLVKKIPNIGPNLASAITRFKDSLKYFIISGTFFEEIGFTYLGPIDGHNIKELEQVMKKARQMKGPIIIHVFTNKGRGYKFSEKDPSKFHSISAFDISSGKVLKKKSCKTYSEVFGDTLCEMANGNKAIIGITAAMKDGTGLTEFAKEYPKQFFDVGIAEQHAVTFSAGLAASGLRPFVAIYSSFLQRAYDNILHDVCIQKLPVCFGIDRSGLVGEDGETHQGVFDISYLSSIPNIVIFAPKDGDELKKAMKWSLSIDRPMAIRYPRGAAKCYDELGDNSIKYGKAELICDGADVTLIAVGNMFDNCYKAYKELTAMGLSIRFVNARFVKPIDIEMIIESINKTKKIVIVEDNVSYGGYGSLVLNNVNEIKYKNKDVFLEQHKILIKAYPDQFVKAGDVNLLYNIYGLDSNGIVEDVLKIVREK